MEVIKKAWNTQVPYSPLFKIHHKLKLVKEALKEWNRNSFGMIQNRIKSATSVLEDMEIMLVKNPLLSGELLKARKNLELELEREEIFMREKSGELLPKNGDRNTRYFSSCVQDNIRNRRIHVKNQLGELTEDSKEIGDIAIEHFKSRFTAESCIEDVSFTKCTPRVITEEENEMLMRDSSVVELTETLNSMDCESAPGPDGFGGIFFKAAWGTIKDDLVEAMTEFLRGAQLPRAFTCSVLVLIPKSLAAETIE